MADSDSEFVCGLLNDFDQPEEVPVLESFTEPTNTVSSHFLWRITFITGMGTTIVKESQGLEFKS